jgi:hypothetical protein
MVKNRNARDLAGLLDAMRERRDALTASQPPAGVFCLDGGNSSLRSGNACA